jgi:hypothetical protein
MYDITRRHGLALGAALVAGSFARPAQAQAPTGGELRIGMTLADIPTARGAPDQGGEGIRWMGFTIYDSLVYWNLIQEETIPEIVPRWPRNSTRTRTTTRNGCSSCGAMSGSTTARHSTPMPSSGTSRSC